MNELIIKKDFRDLIPALSQGEYDELERSVLSEGIREPICIWENIIVDGHHRYSLAQKHDLPFETREMVFKDEEHAKRWMFTNQLSRRNVSRFVHAELALMLEDSFREMLKDSTRPTSTLPGVNATQLPKLSKDTKNKIAKSVNVSNSYVRSVSKIKNSDKVDDKTLNKLRAGTITAGKVLKEIEKEERKVKADLLMDAAAQHYKPEESLQIVNANFYSWCNENLEDHSVDLILTDPPYPKEYLHVWNQLGEIAARVLKPGGYLATYSGQLYLDQVMKALGKYLSYVWTMSLKHTGPTQHVGPRNLICGWKPILIYKNAPAGKIKSASGSALMDFIGDDYREKNFHEWGQGESAVGYLMKTFSYPNDLVLDPFVGGGTTLVVARELNRKCVGIEIDGNYINKIKANLLKSVPEN